MASPAGFRRRRKQVIVGRVGVRGYLAAQPDRVAVGVGEHADVDLWRDLAGYITVSCAGGEQALPSRIEILDIGVRHWTGACTHRLGRHFEAVDVLADVVGLVRMRCAEQRAVHVLGGGEVGHGDHETADRGTHRLLLRADVLPGADGTTLATATGARLLDS